jgi:hypothetical protein
MLTLPYAATAKNRTPQLVYLMKTRLPLLVALALAGSATAPVHAADTPAAASPALSASFVDPEAPENREVREIGERAINRLGVTLVNEVAVAVSKSGAEKALDVCHLKALPLTGEIVSGMPRITAVKRTSLKVRNPANAPDAADQLALEKVDKDIQSGTLPKVLLQRVDRPGAKPEWRVYRPVGMAQQCVTCHGPTESLTPELRARLGELYPKDQATGYAAGQWRGLLRVSVSDTPPPPPPAPAKTAPATKAPKKT